MPLLHTAVIPVAGLGTRVLPASKAIPKEMLPVVDKPVIQHVVEEAINAGFKHIVLVTRSGKAAIEDHFDTHYELESELARKGKTALLASIKDILPADVTITAVRQPKPLGLGHAVLCAAPIIGGDDFAVLLPDMLIHHSNGQYSTDLCAMVAQYHATGAAQIMVEAVPMEHVERYGVVDCAGLALTPGNSQPVKALVEKPPVDQAPSNQAIVGRYILPARVLTLLQTTKPGAGGEIQLTDALDELLKEAPMTAYSMQGKTYDCGNKLGYLQANVMFGLDHPETASALKDFLQPLAN